MAVCVLFVVGAEGDVIDIAVMDGINIHGGEVRWWAEGSGSRVKASVFYKAAWGKVAHF